MEAMREVVEKEFPDAECIMGTAAAGIPPCIGTGLSHGEALRLCQGEKLRIMEERTRLKERFMKA